MTKSKPEKLADGKKRQGAAKEAGAARIRSGQQKQAAIKKAVRARGVKTS